MIRGESEGTGALSVHVDASAGEHLETMLPPLNFLESCYGFRIGEQQGG